MPDWGKEESGQMFAALDWFEGNLRLIKLSFAGILCLIAVRMTEVVDIVWKAAQPLGTIAIAVLGVFSCGAAVCWIVYSSNRSRAVMQVLVASAVIVLAYYSTFVRDTVVTAAILFIGGLVYSIVKHAEEQNRSI